MHIVAMKSLVPRIHLLGAFVLAMTLWTPAADALVVENMTGTTSAPADDPGWNYVTTGGRNYVYLGDGWAMSAFHVGVPTANETLNFNGGAFHVIANQAYTVTNPAGSGLSQFTDLQMVRIDGDPGLAPINIASQQLFESGTTLATREVVIIGNGPTRQASQTRWTVTPVSGPNNDVWTEDPNGAQIGYKSTVPSDNTKRWGKNQIADEDALFGGNDNDLRGDLKLHLFVGDRDIQSMVTQFDMNGLANEAQVVSGDSGSSVFYKRNGVWELIGIINAQYSTVENQNNSYAVYGNYSTFADMTYYRSEIMNIMNSNPNYSVIGDVNLDGVVSGSTANGVPTGDIAAFVAGWGYDNGTGVGTITSWKNGDLNRDGKTDTSDFALLRTALMSTPGGASLSLDSLFGGGAAVPEPTSCLLLLTGAGFFAYSRLRRRG
jgi:hypothetical protein